MTEFNYVPTPLLAPGTAQEGFAGQHSLTVINTGAGYGTVTSSPPGIKCGAICARTFAEGKKVTLKAKPDNDSSFAGWAGGGCTGIDPCSVIMDSDVTVTATFDQKTPEISLSTDKLEFYVSKPGKKVTQTLVISNIGTGNLIVTVSGLEGTDFSISGKSTFVIKPGKSYKLKVNYFPPASELLATDGLETDEPVSGPGESEMEVSSESEDMETSQEGTSSGANDVIPAIVKMILETNDLLKRLIEVPLESLVPKDILGALYIDAEEGLSIGPCDQVAKAQWRIGLRFKYSYTLGYYSLGFGTKGLTNISGSGSCGDCTWKFKQDNVEYTVWGMFPRTDRHLS